MVINQFLDWSQGAPAEKRAHAAGALARAFVEKQLSYEEMISAESALTLLLDDGSIKVRMTLAQELCMSTRAPHNVIMGLANDIKEIASLIIVSSPILTQEDLLEFVRTGTEYQQISVACRTQLPPVVMNAVIEHGSPTANKALLSNDDIELDAMQIEKLGRKHGQTPSVRALLLKNPNISGALRMVLTEYLANHLKSHMGKTFATDTPRFDAVINRALERGCIQCAANIEPEQIAPLVEDLRNGHKLTAGLLLRSLCMGNISMFCVAVSTLSRVPLNRVEIIVSQNRSGPLRSLCNKASIPTPAITVMEIVIKLWRDLLADSEWIERSRMPYLVTRQALADYSAHEQVADPVLINLLQQISRELARDDARIHAQSVREAKKTQQENEAIATFDAQIADSLAIELELEITKLSDDELMRTPSPANDSLIDRDHAQNATFVECEQDQKDTIAA